MTRSSFMIYLVEDGDRYSVEMPEYTVTQLWSDIGGAAGLMLGISFATLIGVVDCLFSFLFVLIRDRQLCTPSLPLTHVVFESFIQRTRTSSPIYHEA